MSLDVPFLDHAAAHQVEHWLDYMTTAAENSRPSLVAEFARMVTDRIDDAARNEIDDEANNNPRRITPQHTFCTDVVGDHRWYLVSDGILMSTEAMSVNAVTSVTIEKPSWQQELAVFTRAQTKMLISAAALMGSRCAQEFAVEVLQTIQQPVSDQDFAARLLDLLETHRSTDLVEELQYEIPTTKQE